LTGEREIEGETKYWPLGIWYQERKNEGEQSAVKELKKKIHL